MKIQIKLENGKPIIFLLSELDRNQVTTYTDSDMHCSATRGYMRSLPDPVARADILACWQLLERYARHVDYCMRM